MLSTPPVPLLEQQWDTYTADDHDTWDTLVTGRLLTLRTTGASAVRQGIETLCLTEAGIPNLTRLNQTLQPLTGWRVVGVDGYLDARSFFSLLAERRFPSTTHVRPFSSLEYIPSPDIFHDVFGHVPLHAHPPFAAVLQRFGRLGARADTEAALVAVQRLFWYTVEFGLIEETGEPRLYGSGLVSSIAEERQALNSTCERRAFDLDAVINTPFDVEQVQPVYFVIRDFAELAHALNELSSRH